MRKEAQDFCEDTRHASFEERSILVYVSTAEKAQQRSRFVKRQAYGELAQLGEHLPCTQGVKGSIPLFSTIPERVVCTLKTE